jgi:purine-binding chemotaxis protein CheW
MNLPTKQVLSTAQLQGQSERNQYLTFASLGEMYAMGILNIKEILEYQQPATVPMMPSCIKGVINLRGAVVPVVDLAVRLGSKESDISKRSCIVIVENVTEDDCQDVGVIVDSVTEVLEISDTEIEAAPSFGANIHTDFIQGMGKVDKDFVVILNVGKVLSVKELAGD